MRTKSVFVAIVLIALSLSVFAQTIPNHTGNYVNDFANIISPDSKIRLESTLRAYEKETSIEIAIMTVSSLQGYTVEEFTNKLANTWGVGKKGVDNGLVILLAPNEHRWRAEVGTGLEPYITDAHAKMIGEHNLTGVSRTGKYGEALEKTVTAIKEQLGSSTWEIREESRRAEQKRREKESEEATAVFVNVLLILLLIGVIASVIGIIVMAVKRQERERQNAAKALQDLEEEYAVASKRLVALSKAGFFGERETSAKLSPLGGEISKFVADSQKSRKYAKIVTDAGVLSGKIKDATGELFEKEDKLHYVEKTLKSVTDAEKTVRELLPEGLKALHTLKQEAPKKVWGRFEHLKDSCDTSLARAAVETKEAQELSDMKVQKFKGAAVKIDAALVALGGTNTLIQDVLDKLQEWKKAKEHGEKRLAKMSKEKADEFRVKHTDDGCVNWLLLAAVLSQSGSHSDSESTYRSSESTYTPSESPSTIDFGGGGFSGGGASGEL